MTAKRFDVVLNEFDEIEYITDIVGYEDRDFADFLDFANEMAKKNEQLKKGMIGVVDRYIKNVECNPPSSARTYLKIKGALINIRDDLESLIEDLE